MIAACTRLDQAAKAPTLRTLTSRGDQIDAKHSINSADHLGVKAVEAAPFEVERQG
jgi:hypothetical protein